MYLKIMIRYNNDSFKILAKRLDIKSFISELEGNVHKTNEAFFS